MKESSAKHGRWRIGQLAKAAGVSTDTLRYYERKGLLHSERTPNGYRQYTERSLERVGMIRKALAVGFTLDELSAIFKVYDGGGAPCRQVRTLGASKLNQIESRLKELMLLRDDLKKVLTDWDKRLAKTTSGQRAGLLKAVATRNDFHSSTHLLLGKIINKKGQTR